MPERSASPTLLMPWNASRPLAPAHVWNWLDYSSWQPVVWDCLADVVDDGVKQAFLNEPPEYLTCDSLAWLDDIILSECDIEVDSKTLLADRLIKRFKAFRAAHGARPEDVASYYRDGFVPLSPTSFHDRARDIFLSGEFPELSEQHLQRAIKEVGTDQREGCVWFAGNEKMLVEECGHYMLYGSEYLTGLAAWLGTKQPDYRQVLKRFGVPTVFVCDVPLSYISPSVINSISGKALEMVFLELQGSDEFEEIPHFEASFCLRQGLPPEHIVGHYHPTGVRDPLLRSW